MRLRGAYPVSYPCVHLGAAKPQALYEQGPGIPERGSDEQIDKTKEHVHIILGRETQKVFSLQTYVLSEHSRKGLVPYCVNATQD